MGDDLIERLRDAIGKLAKWGAPDPVFDEAATTLEAALALLREARLQLEYMDERSPSGTTPAVLARINSFLGEDK